MNCLPFTDYRLLITDYRSLITFFIISRKDAKTQRKWNHNLNRDKAAVRSIASRFIGGRKVRATQSTMFPNRKVRPYLSG